ncbi:MAG TPA: potassium channel protein [Leucothrix sp.]|nr:potassium channel protein [Leucothrix sp.]
MPNLIFVLFRRLRSPLITLIIVYAISIIGFVLIPGVDDQGNLWKMSFFHAFYFVSFMGTTIGFGEIPYAFTDAQRFWALLTMYATVVAWLYGIGVLLSVFQDKAFLRSLKANAFNRRIKNIREPFYIICGYGDTGSQLTHALADAGILSIVIDSNEDRINELEADDFLVPPVSLCADVSLAEVLENAGIKHPWCLGIITLANDDSVNLTVAVVAELLNPELRLISRAETPEAEANILSFGANEVINPFETFASRLALALKSPSLYCLYDWMTGPSGRTMREPPMPKTGKWIICGFGRFGRTLYDHLDDEGISLQVIEPDRTIRDMPSGSLIGRPTEAVTLTKAGIEDASGIIAATNNDANNLSIIMTAQEINRNIFCIARENQDKNAHLFQSANLQMLMQRGTVISNTIFAFTRTPMLGDFLRIVSRFKNDKANELVSRIVGVVYDDVPVLWEICINEQDTPALSEVIQKQQVLVADILCGVAIEKCDKSKHITALALFLKRGKGNVLLPEKNRIIRENDRFLMCGTREAHQQMLYVVNNINLLESVLNGENLPAGWLFRKLRFKGR